MASERQKKIAVARTVDKIIKESAEGGLVVFGLLIGLSATVVHPFGVLSKTIARRLAMIGLAAGQRQMLMELIALQTTLKRQEAEEDVDESSRSFYYAMDRVRPDIEVVKKQCQNAGIDEWRMRAFWWSRK